MVIVRHSNHVKISEVMCGQSSTVQSDSKWWMLYFYSILWNPRSLKYVNNPTI